jgi:hypothetical protein
LGATIAFRIGSKFFRQGTAKTPRDETSSVIRRAADTPASQHGRFR